uniref:Uncharacterized protein n=1 Tax=Physcomitrium patens TaxID=3218 RepID=A0A7I3YY24_PHYPA
MRYSRRAERESFCSSAELPESSLAGLLQFAIELVGSGDICVRDRHTSPPLVGFRDHLKGVFFRCLPVVAR